MSHVLVDHGKQGMTHSVGLPSIELVPLKGNWTENCGAKDGVGRGSSNCCVWAGLWVTIQMGWTTDLSNAGSWWLRLSDVTILKKGVFNFGTVAP